ncbi:MAG: AraC family transcriptional regulator [Stomatobaculum sp.]
MEAFYTFDKIPMTLEREKVSADIAHQELTHWHDAVELIHVRKGNIHCHVNDSDFCLEPGELCFINHGQLHRVYCVDQQSAEIEVLILKPVILSQNETVYDSYVHPLLEDHDFSHVRLHRKNGAAKVITRFMEDLKELSAAKPTGYELDALGIVHMIFRRLYMLYSAKDAALPAYDSDIALQRKMNHYIYEHYAEKIELDSIAAVAGVSRSKCSAMFQKYTQKSPIAFLNSYRLEMGAKLLRSTEDSIAEIALACGFGQQSYFNRVFLREFGCTPLAYRHGKGRPSASVVG